MQERIYAPEDWGKLKSNTYYAWIDNVIHPVRPSKTHVLYKSRWREIKEDCTGATYLEYPGAIVYFEIKKFDKRE